MKLVFTGLPDKITVLLIVLDFILSAEEWQTLFIALAFLILCMDADMLQMYTDSPGVS